MSYDEIDAWDDAAMDAMYEQVTSDPSVKQAFYEELYPEIVQDFTETRLRSFYEAQPTIIAAPSRSLTEAKQLLGQNDTSAFILATIAADVSLILALLRPIVHGLVHSDTAAAVVARLATKTNDENFVKLLLGLLEMFGGVDLIHHKRSGVSKALWEEMGDVRRKRNRVMHQAEQASHEDAELAIAVATVLVEELFPAVIKKLGLHLHDLTVCGALHQFDLPKKASH